LKLSIELKILIVLLAVAAVMWFIFSSGDNMNKVVVSTLMSGQNCNIDHLDPIYTTAFVTAGTYGIFSKNLTPKEISKVFWYTYFDRKIVNVKILKKSLINKKDLNSFFSKYVFVSSKSAEILKKDGYIKDTDYKKINSTLDNYNIATVQTMLSTRKGLPQFSAYKLKVALKFDNGKSEERDIVVMRVVSSATGQPYKYLRWAISWIS